MTATATAPVKTNRLTLGGEPRVQLLPPAVREREKARASMRLGVLLVVLGVVIAGGLGGFGFLRSMTTEAALQAANARTADLAAQRGQYIEATRVTGTIEAVELTQQTMTSYEIGLAGVLDALQARLTEGMALQRYSADVQPPWGVPRTVEDVLAPPRIANFELIVTSTSIQQATAFRNSLETLPGFSNAVLVNSAVGTDGVVTTTIQLALATDAVSGRFEPVDEADESTDGDADTTGGN